MRLANANSFERTQSIWSVQNPDKLRSKWTAVFGWTMFYLSTCTYYYYLVHYLVLVDHLVHTIHRTLDILLVLGTAEETSSRT